MIEFFAKLFAGCLTIGIITLIFVLIFGIFFAWIWNCIMPEIFSVPEISYWQAIGLLILGRMLVAAINVNNKN